MGYHHKVKGTNLFLTIVLNVIITVAQIIGGLFSGSLALLSDALHNFSDVLAYGANRLSSRQSSVTKTFGFKRAEIISALFNTSVLMAIAIFLMIESIYKLNNPHPIASIWLISLGSLSIVLNTLSVLLIKGDAHKNMNIKAAYLHLLTDVMTSVAVVVGGILMYFYELYWIDPLISMFIALYLLKASWRLIKSSLGVLMQFAPSHIDMHDLIEKILKSHDTIKNVHHVHLWQLDDHHVHFEAHLDFDDNLSLQASNKITDTLESLLRESFGISHCIFQCEYDRCENKSVLQ